MLALDCRQQVLSCRIVLHASRSGVGAIAAALHRRRHRDSELTLGDELAVNQDARALNHISQLAHVPFPVPGGKQALRTRRQTSHRFLQPLARLPDERRRQVGNVFAALAERRQLHFDDVQPVEEIGSEPAGGDLGAQISIRRGNDMNVDPPRLQRSDTVHLSQLEHSKQLGL